MNDLALIAIGLLFGIVLCVVGVAAAFLFWTAIQMRKESADSRKETTAAIKSNTVAIDKMRGEVGLALSQMDAQRLYEASVAIVGAKKQLAQIVAHLNKVVYASQPPGLDMSGTQGFTLEDEAADDQRMISERNRWLAQQQPDAIDPERVNDFFEQRRRSNRGGIHTMESTPPAAGAYQAVVEQQSEKPVATLPDLEPESELAGTGELFK